MASVYLRNGIYWGRYKENGEWKSKSLGYRESNYGEKKQAERWVKNQTRFEREAKASESGRKPAESELWEEWVDAWMVFKWGTNSPFTLTRYRRDWRRLQQWLDDVGADRPRLVTYQMCQGYLAWRLNHNGKRNTAIHELKFFAQIMDEAIKRNYCEKNPARRLGLKKEAAKEKKEWQPSEIDAVMRRLDEEHFGDMLHVTFLLGYYQASRLRQCAVPLDCIDFAKDEIRWPAHIVKGAKAFTQPIVPQVRERLQRIVTLRRSQRHHTLCDVPWNASILWREFLDTFGYDHLCHHGLRVTFITNACRANIPENKVMRFVNHCSAEVHRIYQKLTVNDVADAISLVPLRPAPAEEFPGTLPSGANS